MTLSVRDHARSVATILATQGKTISTAESCTGGMIAATFTALPRSSVWFTGSIVAYANHIKQSLLGVEKSALEKYGAVSQEVALQMALGATKTLGTNYSIAVTGIAGPTGGSPDKPVGLVWIAIGYEGKAVAFKHLFTGSRKEVREQTVRAALIHVLVTLKQETRV